LCSTIVNKQYYNKYNWDVILPVVIIADLMAAGDQSGWRVWRRPTTPDMWGHDMEVPDITLNFTRLLSKSRPVGEVASVYAASTLTPGAVISGFKIPLVIVFGP
jgi:hypothetical protein